MFIKYMLKLQTMESKFEDIPPKFYTFAIRMVAEDKMMRYIIKEIMRTLCVAL
jgi:hypothetical protein